MLSRYNKAGSGCLLGGLLGPIGLIIAWTMRDSAKLDRETAVQAREAAKLEAEAREERECPYCAERILTKARVCKHCGHDVEPLVKADTPAQAPPPAPPQRTTEPPAAQPQGSKPAGAASSPSTLVSKLPQLGKEPKPPSEMKYVIIAAVSLISIVAWVWYFSPLANRRIVKPSVESGASPTGTGRPAPVVETPAAASRSPIGSGTDAADRHKHVESAKRLGDNYYDNGEYDKAVEAYEGGLKLEPSNAQLLKALRRAQTAKATEEKVNQ